MNLKNQLKLYLKHRSMTASELARKSGISKQSISLWLAGIEPRKLSHVKSVAVVLETTVDHLCFSNGIQENNPRIVDLDSLLGSDWVGGLFELQLRKVKR